MTAAAVVALRETVEASRVVGIVLAYLHRLEISRHDVYVWSGVVMGIVGSIIAAILFTLLFGGFTGRAEEIYEGVLMLVAAGLMTWMVVWMWRRGREMRMTVEKDVDRHLSQNWPLGIFFLVFLSVLREGVETVIFLQATFLQARHALGTFTGATLGIAAAVLLSVLAFRGLKLFHLRHFFTVTSVLLLLFAAVLLTKGIGELLGAFA